MGNPLVDPNLAAYVFGQTGIPTAYTQGLENLGFMGVPFGGIDANFQAQTQFQRLLKDIMDKQMQSFHFDTPNINSLPYNMRSLFNAAAPLLTDPLYGVMTAPGFLSSGYKYGSFDNENSRAYNIYKEQQRGFPNYPAPALGGGGGGGGGGGSSTGFHVGQYTVPLAGGGSMTVNASSPSAAVENAHQGGNTPSGEAPTVVHQPYVG